MCKHVTITHTYTSTFCTKRFFLALWGSIVVCGMIWSGSSLLSDSDSVFTTHDILKTDAGLMPQCSSCGRGAPAAFKSQTAMDDSTGRLKKQL